MQFVVYRVNQGARLTEYSAYSCRDISPRASSLEGLPFHAARISQCYATYGETLGKSSVSPACRTKSAKGSVVLVVQLGKGCGTEVWRELSK
jgi:hypothetical protein